MTTTAQLKPGDVVQHSEHGYGVFYVAPAGSLVMHRNAKGHVGIDDLDEEWERVETCTTEAVRILEDYQQIVSKSAGVVVRDAVVMMTTAAYEAYRGSEIVKPGHVQVRVDDLDPQTLSEWSQWAGCDVVETALLRVGCAMIASQVEHGDPSPHWRAESTPTADEQDANVEAFPHTVMVKLRCPHGCGAPVRAKLSTEGYSFPEGGAWPRLVAVPQHICQPPQPDEPTEFGAKVSVTPDGGEIELFISCGDGWILTNPSAPNFQSQPWHWDYLIERGAVSLGWGDES